MVTRIITFLNKEISGLHQAAYLLGIFSLASQVLALVRDRLLAHTFGASHALDLYYASFRIPDLIFVTVASMVSISVLIPFLTEKLKEGENSAKHFVNDVFSLFFFIIIVVSAVVYVFVPTLIRAFFPAFMNDFTTVVALTRILLLSPILLGISNFLASITQIHKRFFIYALSPILYNIGIIIGIIFLYPYLGLRGLAVGVVVGAFMHLFIQVPFVVNKGLFPQLTLRLCTSNAWRVIAISLPRTLTVSSNELARFFLIAVAASLGGGAISIFSFAFNLQSVPLSIIGVSYSLAAFPLLAKLFADGEQKKFVYQMILSTQHILFWAIPATVLFVMLRAQIVRVILGTGQFSWTDTRLTAAALALFVLSLVPQALTMLFVRAYYSRGNTWRPLGMNLISAGIIVGAGYLLVWLFNTSIMFRHFIELLLRVDDVPGSVALMLPLSFAVGMVINMIIHWIAFERDFPGYSLPVSRTFFQSLASSVVMGFVVYGMLSILDDVFNIQTFAGIFFQGFIAGIVGIVSDILILKVLKNKELEEIWAALHKKIWGTRIVGPDPEGL